MNSSFKNFLPKQYDETNILPINHNYLSEQFSDYEVILKKISKVVQEQDFTLGRAVDNFEERFSKLIHCKHAIGVGSGTDAIFLSLKALGINEGDEVITSPFTFYATIGAIVTSGAKPVFVDAGEDYNINVSMIERSITNKTKAILPIHWSGKPCDMDKITEIANNYNLYVVEDSCHAITSSYKGRAAGSFGIAGCFSLHPLKNLNVWGDGGVISTNDDNFAYKIRLLRNHGLIDRDHFDIFGFNSRLDTIQAVVADHLLDKLTYITNKRITNAKYLDEKLSNIKELIIPDRDEDKIRQVYHIYSLRFERRNELQKFLISKGIDAKIHYPIPMHLQSAAKYLGYKKGDFPIAEKICNTVLSLPVHEFITEEQMNQMVASLYEFYQ